MWLNSECMRTSKNFSFIVNYYLKEAKKLKASNRVMIIKCDVCGAEYSNRLDSCPSCELKKAENDIENDKTERIQQGNLLNVELAELKTKQQKLVEVINSLNMEEDGAQEKQSALTEEFEKNSAEIKRLTERIAELY